MVVAVALMVACAGMAAEPVTLFDFAKDAQGWTVNRYAKLLDTRPGMSAELNGVDPWFEGPAVDIPDAAAARKLRVFLDVESTATGPNRWEIFYAEQGKGYSAGQMVYLEADPQKPNRLYAMIPVLSPKMRFRIDPPGTSGTATLHALRVLPMNPLADLTFEKPEPVVAHPKPLRLVAGNVAVEHHPDRWNTMTLFVDGKKMAETNPAEWLMYHDGTNAVKVSLAEAKVRVSRPFFGAEKKNFSITATVRDAGGAEWTLKREFIPLFDNRFEIRTDVSVSKTRTVLHLPWLTLFSGVGTFGERKSQALLPGVEYLDDEPSSNEKEIRGAAANRRMVDRHKICYPMAVLAADGRWFSMKWRELDIPVSTLFDSPDRVFNSGGHVMGLWSPAVGDAREENAFELYGGVTLTGRQNYLFYTELTGGTGDTIVASLTSPYLSRGSPVKPSFDDAVRLLAAGWLDSKARDGTKFRHAVWPGNFGPQPAQDPPAYMLWLASQTKDETLKDRLTKTAQEVIASLPKDATGVDGISHVWRPTGAFVYGNLDLLVQRAAPKAKQIAERLKDGTATYRPAPDKPDYGSTLGATHCNGFTAISAEEMLAHATLTGDEDAIRAALAVLDKMTGHYAGTVPRGAQPWEMPLHTPDILASARLIRCYVLGYLLSGNEAYLEQARYWAYTGLTMVYQTSPVKGKVGDYATIGVIGATDWEAPNWIGQPVQWCGLVYCSALNDLVRHRVIDDRYSILRRAAQGITIAGLQMTFPLDDPEGRCGLLPDYWLLKTQVGEGPAINPGTLQAGLAEAYAHTRPSTIPPLYTVTRLSDGSLLHVPGEMEIYFQSLPYRRTEEGEMEIRRKNPRTPLLKITTWVEGNYRVLLTRVAKPPSSVTWNDKPIESRFIEGSKVLIVSLEGNGVLEVVK